MNWRQRMMDISVLAAVTITTIGTIGAALPAEAPAPEYAPQEDTSKLERVLTRTSELGLIAFIAIWLLRVVIGDVKADIRKLNETLMTIAMAAQQNGAALSSDLRAANEKLDALIRNLERLDRLKGGDK